MFCFFLSILFPFSTIQYLQMKWPLLDVQQGGLQSRQALKDARSPSPAHIVVSKNSARYFFYFFHQLFFPFIHDRKTNKPCFFFSHPTSSALKPSPFPCEWMFWLGKNAYLFAFKSVTNTPSQFYVSVQILKVLWIPESGAFCLLVSDQEALWQVQQLFFGQPIPEKMITKPSLSWKIMENWSYADNFFPENELMLGC